MMCFHYWYNVKILHTGREEERERTKISVKTMNNVEKVSQNLIQVGGDGQNWIHIKDITTLKEKESSQGNHEHCIWTILPQVKQEEKF